MGVLEQIIKMKGRGMPDEEIVNALSQKGISPREINDALKQAQIKSAVSDYGGSEDLQPSMMPEKEIPSPSEQSQQYQPEGYEQTPQQEYVPQQEGQYAQEQQQYYQPGGSAEYSSAGIDTDAIMEIADHVFSEKIKKNQKQLEATSEAAILLQTKTENISERLKKIETIIDKLQIAILEKVGSYGQNLEGIKKEMSMMQDSFSKMVSPSRESKKQAEEYSPKKESPRIEEIEQPQKRISKKR